MKIRQIYFLLLRVICLGLAFVSFFYSIQLGLLNNSFHFFISLFLMGLLCLLIFWLLLAFLGNENKD